MVVAKKIRKALLTLDCMCYQIGDSPDISFVMDSRFVEN